MERSFLKGHYQSSGPQKRSKLAISNHRFATRHKIDTFRSKESTIDSQMELPTLLSEE